MCYRRLITPRSSMTSPSSASVIIGEGRRSMARANENRTTRRPDDLRRDASEPREPSPCTLSGTESPAADREDRKSTRLNSSHTVISYAVFCLKKKTRSLLLRDEARMDPQSL